MTCDVVSRAKTPLELNRPPFELASYDRVDEAASNIHTSRGIDNTMWRILYT